MSHYNSKKQLLQESQEQLAELRHSLEMKEKEAKAVAMENKMLQLDLDKAQTNEKKLVSRVSSLEAQVGISSLRPLFIQLLHLKSDLSPNLFPCQLAFADKNLRAQNKIHGSERSAAGESCYLEFPIAHAGVRTRAQEKKAMSCDSLDQSSLEDSLNTTR